MVCGKCRLCVVEKEREEELPDGNDYVTVEIVKWEPGDKEKPFCLLQDFYTNVDPEKDCCTDALRKYCRERGEKHFE